MAFEVARGFYRTVFGDEFLAAYRRYVVVPQMDGCDARPVIGHLESNLRHRVRVGNARQLIQTDCQVDIGAVLPADPLARP